MFFEIVNPAIKHNLETKRNALVEQQRKLESDILKRSARLSVIEELLMRAGGDKYVTIALLEEEDVLSLGNETARSMLESIERKIAQVNGSTEFVDRTLASRPLATV